jgi:hypothetical protein
MRPALPWFRLARLAVMAAGAGLLATGAGAAEPERPLSVANHTRHAMLNLYAARIDAPAWQDDKLGEDVLAAGQSATIRIEAEPGRCLYDLRAVFEDGRVETARSVDVCARNAFAFEEPRI